jgi:SET domain-containing protein
MGMSKTYLAHSWLSPKVEVRTSVAHGKGMFATEAISEGEIVSVWGGEFVNASEATKAKEVGMAIQQIDENLFEVFDYAKREEDPTYLHNHSCDPNTWMQDEVTITARREIKPGEELTIDYAMFVLDENYVMPVECQCGSVFCRHTITGKDWQKKELQERYKGHFSPYLKGKIEHEKV